MMMMIIIIIINIITSIMAYEDSNAREGVRCIGTIFVQMQLSLQNYQVQSMLFSQEEKTA
jgi:hypothetical protein